LTHSLTHAEPISSRYVRISLRPTSLSASASDHIIREREPCRRGRRGNAKTPALSTRVVVRSTTKRGSVIPSLHVSGVFRRLLNLPWTGFK